MREQTSNGAVISGPIGSAKTALLADVLGGEFEGAVHLLCSPILGENVFGALSPLLIDFEAQLSEISVLRYLTHRFAPTSGGSKPLVVVEEAHFLDVASAFVLSQLALAGSIRLVLLAVGQGHTEPVVASTELGARLGRISLAALSLHEVADFARQLLGGPPTSATTHSIAAACAGNPLLVSAFLRSACEQEILIESKGWYILTQSHVDNDLHLSTAVSEIQKRLNVADAKALEVLALGGAEEVSVLEEVSGADIGRLLGTGLVKYVAESRVEIAAPLYAQILRDLVPPGRSAQLWGHVSKLTPAYGSLPHSLLWACESGDSVSTERFIDAISKANDGLDFLNAWRLCQLTGALETNSDIAMHGAKAMLGLKRFQSVAGIVDRALHQCDDLRLLREFKSLRATALWHGGDTDDEIGALLQDWKVRTELIQSKDASADIAEVALNRRAIEVLELWVDLAARQDPRAILAKAQRFAASSEYGSLEYLICRDISSGIMMTLGRFVEAADTALESLKSIPSGSVNEYIAGYQVISTALRALFAVGDYAKIRALAVSHEPESPELHLIWSGTLHFWAAFSAVQEGRWKLAGKLLEEARAELAVHDPDRFFVLAEALHDYELSESSRDPACDDRGFRDNPTNRGYMGLENSDATLLAAAYRSLSRGLENTGYLQNLIEKAHVENRFHTEQQLLILLWKSASGPSKNNEGTARLQELCAPGVGRRNGALAAAVSTTASTDTTTLVNAAEELFSSGETGLGTELLAVSLQNLEGTKSERLRGVVLRKLDSWIKELGGKAWGNLAEVLNERVLTNREKEIISLVGQGLSNKEIARELVVSQRTVEGHLYRVFAKLGISGREELDGQL
ncbi:response regulator transcription factor [Paeniglutamicibacter kerguelensis]|uniref:DNA-binding CsgD family transcriptional regulator n=2 Tax=Paeniglutamicibacter kerguelensis TaxID=254788 RepID=A0ABS4X9F3_9MICC|nr:helix-turn-helix transcriptional regulator [Paeniglutamicibacter kerguelensis]MBP2384941.1 DNA-binding CsgD family transcriptional regulator [Paeniglutamicibacter kerguelensis]